MDLSISPPPQVEEDVRSEVPKWPLRRGRRRRVDEEDGDVEEGEVSMVMGTSDSILFLGPCPRGCEKKYPCG